MKFSDITNTYVVLKMPLNTYAGAEKSLDDGFYFAGQEIRKKIAKDEKQLLRSNFKIWKSPYYGRLKGWREDTPVYVIHKGRLAGGAYLCEQNQFGEHGWGQMHYNYTADNYKGKGLFSILFSEIMHKAETWGLNGVIINTDRYLHPEMYEKWGGIVWKRIEKAGLSYPSLLIKKLFPKILC